MSWKMFWQIVLLIIIASLVMSSTRIAIKQLHPYKYGPRGAITQQK